MATAYLKAEAPSSRRKFLNQLGAVGFLSRTARAEAVRNQESDLRNMDTQRSEVPVQDLISSIDFRYAPARQQLTMCFPDDRHKAWWAKQVNCGWATAGRATAI